ncbi:DUF488 domain-containing protein [Phenylobacterium sp.]|jgi:uncharacterized protein YeaO (DUF488 family)|uniref:DUF488 domain-containing protein n=1 Tax=Phenylobacterium sp. TaxID=1871053 RepID=UPI0035AE5393
MPVKIKRIYEPPAQSDGQRILVDRLWPRGMAKAQACIDLWLKDVAPSADLRRWFGHKPERWAEFQKRYLAELAGNPALEELRRLARGKPTTLLYGAKDEIHNQARVLADRLNGP